MTNPRVPATEADRIAGELDKLSSSHRPLLDATASLIRHLTHQPSVDREAVSRAIDPGAWEDELPGMTRASVEGFHMRRQRANAAADRILALASSAPAAAIPAGMKPWAGGTIAQAPGDWDHGQVMWSDGAVTGAHEQAFGWLADHTCRIIAYTPTRNESGLREAVGRIKGMSEALAIIRAETGVYPTGNQMFGSAVPGAIAAKVQDRLNILTAALATNGGAS